MRRPVLHHHAVRVFPLRPRGVGQHGRLGPLRDARPGARQGLVQAFGAERLQHVVDGVHLERPHRVAVVGGDEHDGDPGVEAAPAPRSRRASASRCRGTRPGASARPPPSRPRARSRPPRGSGRRPRPTSISRSTARAGSSSSDDSTSIIASYLRGQREHHPEAVARRCASRIAPSP